GAHPGVEQRHGHPGPLAEAPGPLHVERVEHPPLLLADVGPGPRRGGGRRAGDERGEHGGGGRGERPRQGSRPGPPRPRPGRHASGQQAPQHTFPWVQRGTSGGRPRARAIWPPLVWATGHSSLRRISSGGTAWRVRPSVYPEVVKTMYGPVAVQPVRCRWAAPNFSVTVPGNATGRTPTRSSIGSFVAASMRASSSRSTATPTVMA